MNDIGGQAIEGVELARFHQRLAGQVLCQMACRLAHGRFQQVPVLPVDTIFQARALQHENTLDPVAKQQWYYQPQLFIGGQPGRQLEIAVDLGRPAPLLQVDNPFSSLQPGGHGAKARLRAGGRGHLPIGHQPQVPALASAPEESGRALGQVGHRSYDTLGHILVERAERPGKLQPFLTVVVMVTEEMFVELHSQESAKLAGEQQTEKQGDGCSEETHLQHPAPGAAHETDDVADPGHHQQVHARTHQGDGMENHLPGDV